MIKHTCSTCRHFRIDGVMGHCDREGGPVDVGLRLTMTRWLVHRDAEHACWSGPGAPGAENRGGAHER